MVGNHFMDIPTVPVEEVNHPPQVVPVVVQIEGGKQVADNIFLGTETE